MQSIGERLEEARKRKGVTIREAAEATKIRGEYLNSFENNNFGINVPDIYVRGFLRAYCTYLKINSEKVITDFNANLIGEAKAAKREHREFFGRMELQTPLVSEEQKKSAAVDEGPEKRKDEESRSPMTFFQNLEKEVAIKVGIIGLIALMLVLVIIWVFRSLTSGGADVADTPNPSQMVPSANQTPTAPAAETKEITLVATGDVRVTVAERQTKTQPRRVLLDYHPMVAGQRETVTIRRSISIEYTEGQNLSVEINGVTYPTNKTGAGYSTIDFTKI